MVGVETHICDNTGTNTLFPFTPPFLPPSILRAADEGSHQLYYFSSMTLGNVTSILGLPWIVLFSTHFAVSNICLFAWFCIAKPASNSGFIVISWLHSELKGLEWIALIWITVEEVRDEHRHVIQSLTLIIKAASNSDSLSWKPLPSTECSSKRWTVLYTEYSKH